MKIGAIEVNNPIFLGPMAGVTDWAFRNICTELGAGVTITEMVSSRALCYQDKKSAALLRKTEGGICGAQIFGNHPEIMAKGAQLALEISGCDFLDINMGCPVRKVAIKSKAGSALLKNPAKAEEKLGWKRDIPFSELVERMVKNDLALVEKEIKAGLEKTNDMAAATAVGTAIAKKALDKGITEVVFDRGGFIYQGKIKALAEAAREAGLQF